MIRILKDIDITEVGASVFNRKWQQIHLKQGDMDGACAVYSLMMYLILIKVLNRNEVTNLNTSFKGNTAKGRLFKEFFENEGLCRDGFYFSDPNKKEPNLTAKLNHSFAKVVKAKPDLFDSGKAEQEQAVDGIKSAIDNNIPIMIAIVRKDGAHAILAIGYEETEETVTKLFCLDPGYEMVQSSYWNTVIRINDFPTKKYSHQCITPDDIAEIYIDETLIITKK